MEILVPNVKVAPWHLFIYFFFTFLLRDGLKKLGFVLSALSSGPYFCFSLSHVSV